MDDQILQDQKAWEVHHWEVEITEGGKNYEKGFNNKYWTTKSKDMYLLLNKNMTAFKPDKREPYSKDDILEWLTGDGLGLGRPRLAFPRQPL